MNHRLWLIAAALALTSQAQPLHAETQTWYGFQVGMSGGNAPPPALAFRSEPHVIVVNNVRVVEDNRCDDDVFCSDNMWWRLRGGYWYRAASWRGPWVTIDVRRVPQRVLVVPARHWRHHPRQGRREVIVVREDDRRHGRHRGHDNGRGPREHDD